MVFDTAVSEDAPALVSLINAAYRPSGSVRGWTDERHLLDGPRIGIAATMAALASGRFLVTRSSQRSAIEACLHVALDEDGAWYLSLLAVDPSGQAKGLGAALLGEAERQAREQAAPCLRISVIQHRESLIAWYGRRGFRGTGTSVPFPYSDETVGRPLRDDLGLVMMEKPLSSPGP